MHLRRVIAFVVALCALLVAGRALAWEEAHQSGSDVELRLDRNGVAAVRALLRWRVVRGPLRWIDLANVDASASLEPDVAISAEDGRSLGAHLARRDDRTVRVTVDEPRALTRGTFTFDVRWRVDLVAARALSRDGAAWRLTLSLPVVADTIDSAHTVLDLPAASEEPKAILADTGAVDDSALASLRRDPARDVLELVRPHVGRGESVTWTIRIDPRALPAVVDTRLRPATPLPPPPEPDRIREASLAGALTALALAFGLLVAHKERAFAVVCSARGAEAQGLLPLPRGVRAVLAGFALAAGVGLQTLEQLTSGTLLIAGATLAAGLRGPAVRTAARGPGRWLILRPEDAFARVSGGGHWLDVTSRAGRMTALAVGAAVLCVALAARRLGAQGPWLVAVNSTVLVPLFATGCAAASPPSGTVLDTSWLSRAFRRLRAVERLRVAPSARVSLDGSTFDELRLLVLPRAPLPGFIGVEIGLAWNCTPVGWAYTPEFLARVIEGSAAATKLTQVAPHARSVPGRRTEERVVRLLPRAPTLAGAIDLARALVEALTDRRVQFPASTWTVAERRVARPWPPPPPGTLGARPQAEAATVPP